MLKPATPLSVLLFISFILLLVSVISTPIVHSIPIATFEGYNFGVFGWCKGDQCSSIRVGYTTDNLFGTNSSDDFNLPPNTRHSLSSLLVVHPVAAFCNLVCLGLAVAAHFHSPSHSARYLLGLLILLLPTLLLTLLAFLVDILLFVPHLRWGGWIVLGSTILIAASGVVTCAMRRTLVSRKARKRRIAENAEMSGANFYTRQQQEESKIPMPPILTAASAAAAAATNPPMVNGAPGSDRLPAFATYENGHPRTHEEGRTMDSALPTPTPTSATAVFPDNRSDRQYGPPSRSGSHPRYNGPRDEFGNPVPPSNPLDSVPAPPIRQRSEERIGPNSYREEGFAGGRGGYPPPRGRAGYPPRAGYGARGGYPGPRGPPPSQQYGSRGGYQGDSRGGYHNRGRGGFSMGPLVAGVGGGMAGGGMMTRPLNAPPPGYPPQGRRRSLDQYGRPMDPRNAVEQQDFQPQPEQQYGVASSQPYEAPPTEPYGQYGSRRQSPAREPRNSPYGSRRQSPSGGVRQPSPLPPVPPLNTEFAPVGQAVEMNASGGTHRVSPVNYGPPHSQLRENDSDVQGMVELQQNRHAMHPGLSQSPVDDYNPNEYVPARSNWTGVHDVVTAPNDLSNRSPSSHRAPHASPVEIRSPNRNIAYSPAGINPHRVNSGSSDVYYEDVDPRFAAQTEPGLVVSSDNAPRHQAPAEIPLILQPGVHQASMPMHPGPATTHGPGLRPVDQDPASSYEDLQQGARSPAESETSNFTSVSQRGINPNWHPGMGYPGEVGNFGPAGQGPGMGMMRKPVGAGNMPSHLRYEQQQKRDVLLAGNPDFEIPGVVPGRFSQGGRQVAGPGGAMRGGGSRMPLPGASTISGGADGRYPPPP